jgi:hypothetical protein
MNRDLITNAPGSHVPVTTSAKHPAAGESCVRTKNEYTTSESPYFNSTSP